MEITRELHDLAFLPSQVQQQVSATPGACPASRISVVSSGDLEYVWLRAPYA
jgi:hypothetical protein